MAPLRGFSAGAAFMRPGLNPVAASGEGRMNAPPTGTESSILVGAVMRPRLNPVAASGEGRMNAPPTGTESRILVGAAFMRPYEMA